MIVGPVRAVACPIVGGGRNLPSSQNSSSIFTFIYSTGIENRSRKGKFSLWWDTKTMAYLCKLPSHKGNMVWDTQKRGQPSRLITSMLVHKLQLTTDASLDSRGRESRKSASFGSSVIMRNSETKCMRDKGSVTIGVCNKTVLDQMQATLCQQRTVSLRPSWRWRKCR